VRWTSLRHDPNDGCACESIPEVHTPRRDGKRQAFDSSQNCEGNDNLETKELNTDPHPILKAGVY
jgi:hypothetical protein